jgi:hypothetical protein
VVHHNSSFRIVFLNKNKSKNYRVNKSVEELYFEVIIYYISNKKVWAILSTADLANAP